MADVMVERLARVLVDYSLAIEAGDLFVVTASLAAEPLVREVFRLAARKGAHPIARIGLPGLDEIVLKESPEEALDFVSPLSAQDYEKANAVLTIMGSMNSQTLSGVPPQRMARATRAQVHIQQEFIRRMSSDPPEIRWCGTLFPTYSGAQDAHLSLADYEAFVYHAMLLDTPDPVAAWQVMSARQAHYCQFLGERDEIRVVGDDTDIRMRTQGRSWLNADGKVNFPDGEVFTGPLEDSVNGHIRYTYPTVFQGREAEDVQLWFEDGVVTRWEAKRGRELLDELFAMDEGARRLGEFAIGTNYNIPTFSKNILFDEKIGGTCHLAVGASIPSTGGQVRSALHWDMVCDLRRGGTIIADGETILQDGQWTIP
jgi:aminopeptidase